MSAFDDLLDLARTAIEAVAVIVGQVGFKYKCNKRLCSLLSQYLSRVAEFLDTAGSYQADKIRLRVPKLLRDVEKICTWPHKSSEISYKLLEKIAATPPDSGDYEALQAQVESGVAQFALLKNLSAYCEVTVNLEKFVGKTDHPGADGDLKLKRKQQKNLPPMYASEINSIAYGVMKEHTFCTCTAISLERRHLTQLFLCPMEDFRPESVPFNMLISSAPSGYEDDSIRWQDVKLSVSQAMRPQNRVRFSDSDLQPTATVSQSREQIARGKLCKLIKQARKERICLDIQDTTLYRSGFEMPKQIVSQTRGRSLAEVLKEYSLTPRMKLTLAYIIAYSMWRYYDSDWMKTRWTSNSIRFVEEGGKTESSKSGSLFVCKPYLSVRFGTEDLDSDEFSSTAQIHLYPRVRALGMMLIEVGLGKAISVRDERRIRINGEYLFGLESLKDQAAWQHFDYAEYKAAVKSCFDTELFKAAPGNQNLTAEERLKSLEQRRAIVYENIVFPLEYVLQKCGWMQQINKVGPLVSSSKHLGGRPPTSRIVDTTKAAAKSRDNRIDRFLLKPSQKDGDQFLKRIERLNLELKSTGSLRSNINSAKRIRIAILDTGCDDNAPFFFIPANGDRLKGWKDFTGKANSYYDSDGHGTFAVSLLMKIAPEADVYVARVSADSETLQESSENVAKAIHWADAEWNADIISMSFGYALEPQHISDAIYKAVSGRSSSILFFAAASNDGSNHEEMWPAKHDSVISIRGTDFYGQFQPFNPPTRCQDAASFGTLGVDVRSAWLSRKNDEKNNEIFRSGTSVATVIAAGIAGILLEYVTSKTSGPNAKAIAPAVLQKLRTHRGMLEMFGKLSQETLSPRCWYIRPWGLIGHLDEVRWAKFVDVLQPTLKMKADS